MAAYRFKSLTRSNVRYLFDFDLDIEREIRTRFVHDRLGCRFLEFDTLGDGETQHTASTFTCGFDNLLDVLLSLATAIQTDIHTMSITTQRDLSENLYRVITPYSDADLLFALSTTHKWSDSGKNQYVHVTEQKTSLSATKEHDKRWIKVEEGFNGTVAGAYQMLRAREYADRQYRRDADLFERVFVAQAMKRVINQHDLGSRVDTLRGVVFPMDDHSTQGSMLLMATTACKTAIDALNALHLLRLNLDACARETARRQAA